MARLLDILAVVLLLVSAVVVCSSVWFVGQQKDLAAIVAFVAGVVTMRSSVDLLRPRRLR